MMPGIWNLEWLNQNSQRAYPLAEDAGRRDETEAFVLPDDFILSLYLPVNAGVAVHPARFFIRSISAYATGYNVAIAYDDGTSNPPVVATAVVPRDSHREYDSYALPGTGDFDEVVGRIVIGRLDSIARQPSGRFFFDYAGGKLDPDCIRPQPRAVTSVTVVNGNERSLPLYGPIEIIAGTNMQISVVAAGEVNQVRWDAIDGAGLTENCACEEAEGPPIRTIDHVGPDPEGNIDIIGDDCLVVEPQTHAIRIVDRCSTPCCGCPELEKLARELDQIGPQATTLRSFVDRLKTEMDNMRNVIFTSRLNSQGCSTC
jgi:hypothetical protein